MKTSRSSVLDLLQQFGAREYGVESFCRTFENTWNFEFDESEFSAEELNKLEHLFDVVTWFSPLPRERWEYPKYRDESEVRSAAEAVLLALK